MNKDLEIPRVYITVSEKELLSLCTGRFEDERMARNYIDKVLPSSKRIYMPDISWENIVISPDYHDIKKTFLWKIAEKTNIYFDGCGKKTHFYEPQDIRSLVNMNLKLDEMENVDSTENSAYHANVTLLLQDALYRLMYEKLGKKDREMFWDAFSMETERQGRAITECIIKIIEEGKCVDAYNQYGYSYGEFLRCLYTLGRVNSAYKGIVQCVLAVHTIQLCQIRTQIIKNIEEPSEKKSEEIFQRLFECMNGSVTGSWGNKLVPKMQSDNQRISWGYMRGTIDPDDKQNPVFFGFPFTEKETQEALVDKIKKFFEDDDFGIVKSLVLFTMFLTMYEKSGKGKYNIYFDNKKTTGPLTDDTGEGISAEISEKENDQRVPIVDSEHKGEVEGNPAEKSGENAEKALKEKQIIFQLNRGYIVFDITGFVINCMKYPRVFADVKGELIEAYRKMCDAIPKYLTDITFNKPTDLDQEIENIITEKMKILQTEMENWYKETNGFALPICSTDIFYNVIKRAKTKNSEANVYSIDETGIVESMKTAFQNIADELAKEDEYYRRNGNKLNLKRNFLECPIVETILTDQCPKAFEMLLKCYIPKLASVQATANSEIILGDEL